jgi:hypothetical protein
MAAVGAAADDGLGKAEKVV